MAEISASLVKELRERTGAGMMDCKKALGEVGANLEAAVEWLRKKGLAAAQKKASRVAAEGAIGIAARDGVGVLVEVNSETDFVARNDKFQAFARQAVEAAFAAKGDVEALKKAPYPGTGRNFADELTQLVGTIGENLTLRRAACLSVSPGIVSSYLHNAVVPGLGKIGVLVALKSAADKAKLADLGHKLAMHVAASSPRAVRVAELDPKLIESEKRILSEQAAASGKPPQVIEKMIEGRLRKFYEEVVLMEQTYIIDNETKVGKVVEAAGKAAGSPIEVAAILRFQLGEGIERKESDFAAEVAAAAGTSKA
jgi:elongation factor Ts